MGLKVTARAHPSLALVKYWGNANDELNIPANSSIAVNLDGATTTTCVTFSGDQDRDVVTIDGRAASSGAYDRAVRHLDRVRRLAGIRHRAVVESRNDFPTSSGIASSASAFAALSLAASKAAGLNLDERELSILARKGSGSACRSIPGGFVEWVAGTGDATSYARQIAPAEHWDVRIITVIVDEQAKDVPSSEGHRAARTSPFYQARLDALPQTLAAVRQALRDRDMRRLGLAAEREAVSLHVVAMTTHLEDRPWLSGIYYWQPGTLALMHAVQAWRRRGLEVYFTIDAGQNMHLLCEGKRQADVEQRLKEYDHNFVKRYVVSGPGRGAWVVGEQEV